MNLMELILIAVGLSMDALAIALCKGLSVERVEKRHMIITGMWFGGAQAMMPLLGYFLGTRFQEVVENIDHWIAFILLGIIGISMIKESREEIKTDNEFFKILPLVIAQISMLSATLKGNGREASYEVQVLPMHYAESLTP